MSRCFPFPPPGYEKKARTDEADLLKKEKHREKKHKKEKKDKDKRGSREKDTEKRGSIVKSEKDKSDGKHREKKDKKEKHRDKNKDKEKDRDTVKDKISATDDKRIPGKNQSLGAEKLVNNEFKYNFVDKRDNRQVGGYQAEKLSQNHHLAEEKHNSEFVELGWRIKEDESRGIGNRLVEKVTESDHKTDEGMVRLVAKATDILVEVKERNKEKRFDDRKVWLSGNTMAQKPTVMVETKVEGIRRPFESNVDRKIDGKETTKEKQGDDSRGDKSKDKGREKRKQGKGKDKVKEKKKEAKQKEKNECKNSEPKKEKRMDEKKKEKNRSENAEPDKLKMINKEDHVKYHSVSVVMSQFSKDINKDSGPDANLKKRKELKPNGVLHANDVRPSKLSRASSSSHPVKENGRPVEPCQTSIFYVSDRPPMIVANNVKVENKDRKISGIIEAPSFSVSRAKPPHIGLQADLFAEAPMRPPHPDSKNLRQQVYLVPKVGEVPDFDDQDWLFGCSDTQSKRPKVESSGVAEIPPQVWSEALRIESADVHVLPYVIPY